MENNYAERIVNYCKYKNKIIKKATGITYMNKEDYAEIRNLTEDKIKFVLDSLINNTNLIFSSNMLASFNCPFCWMSSKNETIDSKSCTLCGYQKRHGYCLLSKSTYREITDFIYNNRLSSLFSVDDKKKLYNILKGNKDEINNRV